MKLWLISQTENDGYDVYDSAVVAAETEEDARQINPCSTGWPKVGVWGSGDTWCERPDQVKVELIGEAAPHIKAGVVLGSFNAG